MKTLEKTPNSRISQDKILYSFNQKNLYFNSMRQMNLSEFSYHILQASKQWTTYSYTPIL